MNLLERAETLAREAHEGQLYGTRDFIEGHIEPVVGYIARLGYGDEYKATGWIHDVVEKSDKTTDDLIEEGIPLEVVTAVNLLTIPEGGNRLANLQGVLENPLAAVTRLADSTINLANAALRSPDMDEEEFERKISDYSDNIAILRQKLFPIKVLG